VQPAILFYWHALFFVQVLKFASRSSFFPQASTNTLLCHVIGLLFTNLMLRIINKPRKEPKPA